MNPEQTLNENGAKIQIFRDPDPISPSAIGDEDIFLVAFHRQFSVKVDGFDSPAAISGWKKTHHVFPLYAYIHGGVSLSLSGPSCRWDSGQVGFVLISKSCGDKQYAELAAKSLVSEWQQYLDGDIYGFTVTVDGEEETCWGFYGIDVCIEEARATAGVMNKQLSLPF